MLTNITKYIERRFRRYFLPIFWKIAPVVAGKKNHTLPGLLIVSVTSYPPRFPTLTPVLKTILSQSTKPDKIILWIAKEDEASLPSSVRELGAYGLTIGTCANLRSYKKIIPTIEQFPDAFVVTADDDILYRRNWLETLVSDYRSPNEVLFHRGHTITVDANMGIQPYEDWCFEKSSEDASVFNFPTSGAGALYPPGIFDRRVTESELFLQLAPTADDLWLYWMARLGGATFRRVGPQYNPLNIIRGSQHTALADINNGPSRQNSVQLKRLVLEFGNPFDF